jgi:3-phenylpropionate/trans-cinnamate dioxygenase ferredoxin subunit
MSTKRVVGKTADFPEGKLNKVVVDQQEVLLVQLGGKFYATADRCPHMKGDLSKGTLNGNIVTCPRHGSQFDLTNGEVKRWMKGSGLVSTIGKTLKHERNLPTYTVTIEGDTVLVEV